MRYTRCESWEEYKADFAERFTLEDSYVICGAGGGFGQLTNLFPEIKIHYCLDARAAELSSPGNKVYLYESLNGKAVRTQKFIVTAKSASYIEIRNTLLTYGASSENIASLQEIIFFWGERYRGKIFSSECFMVLTTSCNLRCRGCGQFVPYVKNFRYYSADTVIGSLEQYFRIYDSVGELILTGGKTMLYKELGQVCAYIGSRLGDRYQNLRIFTNGLITPTEAVMRELSKLERVQVWISDYTGSIEKVPNKLIEHLIKYEIPYKINRSFGQSANDQWFDLGDPTRPKDGDARERFRKCSGVCLNLIDRKIYYCGPSCVNAVGGITALKHTESCLDLDEIEQLAPAQRTERIGKFNLGFLDKGRLEFCRFCNGLGEDVNTRYITAGTQC